MIRKPDGVVIVSSWGLPEYYRESYYVLEMDSEEGRRIVVPGPGRIKKRSSTAAIEEVFRRYLGVERVELLVFVQDTILLQKIIENWNLYRNKILRREELENILLNALYDSKIEVARELGAKSSEAYRDIVRFVPGVISHVRGACLYTWRGERAYDVLRGTITLHTYVKLEELHSKLGKEASEIAVILDTTHGINYFASALKDGTLAATELFALKNVSNIRAVTVYHYNSDPMPPEAREEVPSLKLHLLDKINIVKDGKLYTSYLAPLLREVEVVHKEGRGLENFWREGDWNRILAPLSFYPRGLLAWALRATLDRGEIGCPEIGQLEQAARDIRIKFEQKGSQYKISYELGMRCPIIYVVLSSIPFRILQEYAERAREKRGKVEELWNYISEVLELLATKKDELPEVESLANILEKFLKLKNQFICFKLREVVELARKVLTEPLREINVYELENRIGQYLSSKRRGVLGWKEILAFKGVRTYREPRGRAYFIVYDDRLLLVPSLNRGIDKRNVYAHAGLAYSLKWLAINLGRHDETLLCLGEVKDLRKVLGLF